MQQFVYKTQFLFVNVLLLKLVILADGNVLCKTDLPTESNPVVTCRHSSHCKLQSFFEESQRTNPNQWATEVQCDENCTTGEHLVNILVLLTNCCSIANINYTKCTWQISSTNELELYGQKPPDPNKVDLPTETLTSTESIILLPTSYSSANSTVLTSATALPSSPTDSRPTDNDDKPFYEIPPWILITIGTVLLVLSVVLGIINAWLVKLIWQNIQQRKKLS